MKKILLVLFVLSFNLSAELNTFDDVTPLGARSPLTVEWDLKDGIDTPESAYFDSESGFLFVSNVAGEANKKDGRGWVTKAKPTGKVVVKEWVKGFDAPKGMRAYKGSLWVSDIDRVHEISIKEGKVKRTIAVPGAVFLNDVAVDSQGNVYVSDTIGSKIYRLSDGKPEVFATGPELESPNGLLIEGDTLFVAAWGLSAPDFSTKVPGRLYAMDLKNKAIRMITPAPFGNLDGLERAKNGFWITDWKVGKLFLVSNEGKSSLLVDGLKGAADLAYILSKDLVVVPRMGENLVTAYSVSKLKL